MKGKYRLCCGLLIMFALFFTVPSGVKLQAAHKVADEWVSIGGEKYYINSKGKKAIGWKQIKGKRYYFKRTGELVTSSWVGMSYVDARGAMVRDTVVQRRIINKTGKVKKLSVKEKIIVIGASRVLDMSIAVNRSDTIFIAKGGQKYDWFSTAAIRRLKKYLVQKPLSKVVIQMGNNDMENIDQYIACYQKLIKKYPETEFYFLEITPGDSENKNNNRIAFNEKLKEAFGPRCIGGYDYLVEAGYKTVDGTHYTSDVSEWLYGYIRRKVNEHVYSPSSAFQEG